MKLQPKRQVHAELATQRKQQIDEGLKIARKVDAVRKELVVEEGKLERFRTETIARVQVEIDDEIRKRDALTEERKKEERRLAVARIPLDAEWLKLQEQKESLLSWEGRLETKDELQKEKDSELLNRERELVAEKGRMDDFKRTISLNLTESESTLKHAKEQAADMRNQAQTCLMEAELKLQLAIKQEEKIAWREREIKTREDVALQKEIELAKRERQLRDREGILQRNIKRLEIKH